MKILVTGPCGFVGARIMHMTAGAIASPSLRNMDESAVRQLVESVQPELVVHTAAVSDISACDRDPEASRRANVLLPCWLVKTGVKCVIFSSDQVYSACKGGGPYAEGEVCPGNLYARQTLEMEEKTLAINPDTVLLRATWMYDMPIYGLRTRGTFLMNLLPRPEIAFSATQHRAVTYVREVAAWIPQAAQLPGGAYNYGSENNLTALKTAQWLKDRLHLPVRLSDAGQQHHLWMDCAKAKAGGIHFENTVGGLEKCIRDYGL